jgi:hypothetical protein
LVATKRLFRENVLPTWPVSHKSRSKKEICTGGHLKIAKNDAESHLLSE